MLYPNHRREKKLQRQGYHHIAGVDEAGRGAWAGPLVAGVVVLDLTSRIPGIKDSKLLRSPDRKQLFDLITAKAIAWAAGIVEANEIDRLGLTEANLVAFERAIKNLKLTPDYILIDGLAFRSGPIQAETIVDGDYKVTSIAAGSIIAKVTRDQIMDQLDEQFPHYGFKHHKGYGTSYHHQMLMYYGPSSIHRQSYAPIAALLNQDN